MVTFLTWLATQTEKDAMRFEADSLEGAAELRLQHYHNAEGGNMTLKHGSKRLVNVCTERDEEYRTIAIEVVEAVQFVAQKGE